MKRHALFEGMYPKYQEQIERVYNLYDDVQAEKFSLALNEYQFIFQDFTRQHIDVLKYTNKPGYTLVNMTLAYKLIDNLGWLHSDEKKSQNQFTKYVDDYVIPYMDEPISSKELWASRCAVFHTNTYESRDTEKYSINKVVFFTGNVTKSEVESKISELKGKKDAYVALNTVSFVKAILKGLQRFTLDNLLNGRVFDMRDRLVRMPTNIINMVVPNKK